MDNRIGKVSVMHKKLISIVLSSAMLIGAAYIPALARGEKVTLIVETEGAPLLETKDAVRMGASEYMQTDSAKETEARLLSAQSEVKSDIKKRVRTDVDSGFTYTSVLNGFSMEAYESDIAKIKAIDGVKNVYISQAYEIPPELSSNGDVNPGIGAQMMNAQTMYDEGYDGRGQAVAIIDSEFDVVHEFFASDIANPKFTKNAIKELIENNELNVDIAANQVYKSEKIPFAYDYGGKDADTYDAAVPHGNHVAGIAAGKDGVFEGTTFSGVAPEAQLVLMKVMEEDGSVYNSTIIAAMDDASKMGICAVNLSLGSPQAEDSPYLEATDNLRNAGIAVVCSAGNSDRYNETTDNPDYTYRNLPAAFSSSTSVASIDPDKKWLIGGRIELADGSDFVVSEDVYNEVFFTKFSDDFYDYVYVGSETEPPEETVRGKIVIATLNSGIKSQYLLDNGAIGMIFIIDEEIDGRLHTVSDEIPGIGVRKSFGDMLTNANEKRLKTDAEIYIDLDEHAAASMAYYTSWSTGDNLELKPEITAPGSDILSSVNDDQYENKSGTSMASPHITGAMAIMSGFVEAKYPDVTGADKIALMENLLMSSADIVFQDDEKTLPESPRRQGAGLANLGDAMTLPVILKGDMGKSKLSLRDGLDDNITLTFTAKNLTGEDVTYDDIKIYAFTDNYEEQDGKNMITDSVPLKFEPAADNPESVTIPANGEKEITLNITLDETQTAANKEIFTNGFWVDGFVVLSSSDGSVTEASMPYTGFYGDWTSFDAMTPSYFEEGGGAENGGLMLAMSDTKVMLGTNALVDSDTEDKSEYESEDYAGLSAVGNFSYKIYMRMLRSLRGVTETIKDSNGDVIFEKSISDGLTRMDSDNNYMSSISIDPTDLWEGDYSVTVFGTFAYDSERSRTEEKTYKFYVDSTPPEISDPKIYEENGKTYASFEASDNRYLMGAAARDADGKIVTEAVKAEKQAQITLDVTDMDRESLEFAVADYAMNANTFKIGSVSAEITNGIISGNSAVYIADVTNTADDTEADVIMAVYSGDGRLIGIDKQTALLKSGAKTPFTFSFTEVPMAADAKLFVWKRGETEPLCSPCIWE